ncbi:protein FLOWERING LOCUS T [Trifolium repens]|nr:protein FLOWERING LOCUS T [Trifolium repens]
MSWWLFIELVVERKGRSWGELVGCFSSSLPLPFFLCILAPSPGTSHTMVLRLVTDIPATTEVSFGNEVVSYERPRPTSGIHRFVFVLFRQQCRQRVYAPRWRQNFNTREFAELYNLVAPVAAVFFNCQRESGSGGRTFR